MKVAIVHYWFINWRGGEKVVEALLDLFPQADLFTHVYDESLTEGKLKGRNITTTFISKLPGAKKHYQKYLPLMPIALEQLDLREYDLVISSESGPAKGIIISPDATHICYCHSPMRYVWDMYPDYVKTAGLLSRWLMRPLIHYLKIWDRLSADRVDYFIANSSFVAKRINKFYRRSAEVIHPPVDIDEFELNSEKSDFYLLLGQLTHYKRADLAVDAFLANGKKLIVIGDGEQYQSLKALENDRVKVLGRASWDECKNYLSKAKALIFPGVEDFGMVPVEAMACGTPVLAFAKGGALETVNDGHSGYLFYEQTVESLNACINKFEEQSELIDSEIRNQAELFSMDIFKKKMTSFIQMKVEQNN
ncbi:MAG: glycosyltransferase [Gammaproteobacteria bacterium]|jgi:glycosyltransferase involved in cell wall biosynthesis|nr:glycosyltransferase [Gammaproteobacteria bacterium]MBT4077574.1 glycosyltransferase [Gammaproteobacteria bacterium]MBT4195106.1 glycosyltransferase [Gammaproteobacteria bacterium]MBT4449079.1 glycosyltransferase [Gammaproteobacteria bacterium]MBT6456256.1 glycosyltransferase [Gammaproteobacteria bacterium]